MKKKMLLLALLAQFCSLAASAVEVTVNGLKFEADTEAKTAKVISDTGSDSDGKKLASTYSGSVIIPASITVNGVMCRVIVIDKSAFYSCTKITSVAIPRSVTSIGISAFSGCNKLSSVTIPNSVTYLGSGSFKGCEGLTSITIPESVKVIGQSTFENCSNLTSISIPESVYFIGLYAFLNTPWYNNQPDGLVYAGRVAYKYKGTMPNNTKITLREGTKGIAEIAFQYQTGLVSISIPKDLQCIGQAAFYKCPNLTSVVLPDSLKTLENIVFYGCSNLTSLKFPAGLTEIRWNAFEGCTSLSSITLPANVKYIYEDAFKNCINLTDVYCEAGAVPETNATAFDGCDLYYATLHVPANSLEAYKSTAPWSEFGTIVALPSTAYTLTYVVDGQTYKTYEVTVGDAITPEAAPTKTGCTFSGWSEIPATMPDHDVTITGTFTPKTYKLTYVVDEETYKTYNVAYGSTITPEPAPTKNGYRFSGWEGLPETMPARNVTVTGSFTRIVYCAKPSIIYENGQLRFECTTSGATFKTTIKAEDAKSYSSTKINLALTYVISVYATKSGYDNSPTATATLCWLDATPEVIGGEENITVEVAEVKARPVLIQNEGGDILLNGVETGTAVSVYDLGGRLMGRATATDGTTRISTNLTSGQVAIVHIGHHSTKVTVK